MIWTSDKWKDQVNEDSVAYRKGLRFRFDSDVHPDVKESIKNFAKWLRCNYCFPIRVTIYIKSKERVRAKDGDLVCGTFCKTYDHSVEPYGKIATGDYLDLLKTLSKESTTAAINYTIAHELTHYYQWLNDIELTPRGEEWQASFWANRIIDEYEASRGFYPD